MTYPQGYTPPPPPPKPKPDPRLNLKPTQSDTFPIELTSSWHDMTTMDDHLHDFEKENYSDFTFKKTKPKKIKSRSKNKKLGLIKRILLKLKIYEEVKVG